MSRGMTQNSARVKGLTSSGGVMTLMTLPPPDPPLVTRLTSNRVEVRALAGGTLGSTSPTLPPDVVEPWGSSHGELSRSPHSPSDAVATPQVVSGKFVVRYTPVLHELELCKDTSRILVVISRYIMINPLRE
ncbi:jg19671 [Pararge aegeria aegeria]|uniref:Jg19671 protein n=1 Tax=Pararge aegeria aegeria TaxID=348720 RepID=A0A8S4RZC9_9NEOP|nr:jg19671 [Pararge aegeria aegeria]